MTWARALQYQDSQPANQDSYSVTKCGVGGRQAQLGDAGPRGDARPGQGGAVWCGISSRCSERRTIENLRTAH